MGLWLLRAGLTLNESNSKDEVVWDIMTTKQEVLKRVREPSRV